ncbi:MAG: ferredoxin [Bacillota bacterium]
MAKPKVDPDLCIACGLCEQICPDVFEMGDDVAYAKDVNCEDYPCCDEARESCPVEAITCE